MIPDNAGYFHAAYVAAAVIYAAYAASLWWRGRGLIGQSSAGEPAGRDTAERPPRR